MAARSTMLPLIASIRVLINDLLPIGSGQIFSDQVIQDVLDEGRLDVVNGSLSPKATYSGSGLQYLDYYSDMGGGWEDGMVLKQNLSIVVTPSAIEPIAGHFQFAANTFPPVYITGILHDRYRAAADLLERLTAQWVLSYSMTVDGQSLQRNQATRSILLLVKEYRRKQRPRTITVKRGDFAGSGGEDDALSLAPRNIDYYSSGSKQG
jgi:hypothetical protein